MLKKTEVQSLKQCAKCDCYISPIGNDSMCFTNKVNIIQDNTSRERIFISPTCQEIIKIYVKGHCREDEKSSYATQTSYTAFEEETRIQQTESVTLSGEEDSSIDEKKKKGCFSFFRRKKKTDKPKKDGKQEQKNAEAKVDDQKKQEVATVEDPKKMENSKKLEETMKVEDHKKAEQDKGSLKNKDPSQPLIKDNVGDVLQIHPKPAEITALSRDRSSGDGLASLENFIRAEAKTNRKTLEEILAQLYKQKRDLEDIKDVLDTVSKAVREMLYVSSFGKGKAELLGDLNRKNNLERKSNSLSLTSDATQTSKQGVPGEVPKKKRFFSWCK